MSSPLAPLFPDTPDLPEAFRLQFLHSAESDADVLVEGVLDEVWYRPRWLAPLFHLLEWLGILVAERARNVRTTLRIAARYDRQGNPYHLWHRRFYGRRTRKFDVRIVFDRKSGRAVDLVGRGGFLALGWDVRFDPPGTLHLDVVSAGLRLGGRIFWLPDALWPLLLGREEFVQTVESEEEGRFRIHLLIRHPVLGEVFCYRGRFGMAGDR